MWPAEVDINRCLTFDDDFKIKAWFKENGLRAGDWAHRIWYSHNVKNQFYFNDKDIAMQFKLIFG